MTSFIIFKTVRDPLILGHGVAAEKSYATAMSALLLPVFIPAYGWLFRHCTTATLVRGMALAFAAMAVAFALAHAAGWNVAYGYYVGIATSVAEVILAKAQQLAGLGVPLNPPSSPIDWVSAPPDASNWCRRHNSPPNGPCRALTQISLSFASGPAVPHVSSGG